MCIRDREFAKFVADHAPETPAAIPAIRHFFKAYLINGYVREHIDRRQFASLATNAVFSLQDYKAVPEKFRTLVPEYIKDYVPLNQFAA